MILRSMFLIAAVVFACGNALPEGDEGFYPIRTIDPTDTEFSDLAPLKDIIGDSRVVLLGEQSHGTGSTFLGKTRLVKCLHEELGFDVLAFESGIFDCDILYDSLLALKDPTQARKLSQKAVFRVWTRSPETEELFQYIIREKEAGDTLTVCGFDDQVTGVYSEKYMTAAIQSVAEKYSLPIAKDPLYQDFLRTLDKLNTDYNFKPAGDESERFFKTLGSITTQLEDALQAGEDDHDRMMLQALRSLDTYTARIAYDSSSVTREYQMARNLAYLTQRYPDKKIVCWAASYHALRNYDRILNTGDENTVTMGTVFADISPVPSAVIGFTSYTGEHMNIGTKEVYPIGEAEANSIETWAHEKGKPYAIIDLDKWPNKDKPVYARPLGHSNIKGYWWDAFDAFIYVDEAVAKNEDPR